MGLVLAVDPACCPAAETGLLLMLRRLGSHRGAATSSPPDPAPGRRNDRLQRHRGRRGDHRGYAGLLVRVGRFRAGLGHRGDLRRGRGLAVLRRTPRPARRPRCGSSPSRSSRWPPSSPSTRCVRCSGGEARHSPIGIVLAAASLVIMPVLSYAQRRAGRELGSLSAVADSKQTLLCTYLSAVLLVGLVLNSLLGWSWADPVAALVIAAIAVREGLNAGAATRAADEGSRCASCRARAVRRLRGARIRLAQLGTTTPHRIDGIPRHQRATGLGGMVRRSRLRRRTGGGGPRSGPATRWRGVAGGVLHAPLIQLAGIVDRGGRHRRDGLCPTRHG